MSSGHRAVHGAASASAAPPPAIALNAAFAGCALIWGSTFLAISFGNDTVPPMWAATLRLALAAPLLAVIARLAGQRLPRGRALAVALAYGAFNFGFGFPLLYWAEKSVPSGVASVFFATIPLTSTLLTRAVGLEKMTPMKVTAAVVAFAGVAVIFSDRIGERVPVAPMLALLMAATSAALGTVVLKLGPRQPPVGVNAAAALSGLALCLAASFLAGEAHAWPRTLPELFPILYLTIAGSIVAFVLMAWLVNHWDVTRISFVSVIVPVVALVLGALFRDERPSLLALAGSLLVLAGVTLRIRAERRPLRA